MRDDRRVPTSLIVLLVLVAVAVVGPPLWRWDHTVHREIVTDAPPSLGHPFGTSRTGHDVLGQVLRGLVQSLRVAVVATSLGTIAGGMTGLVAGRQAGWVDAVAMRLVDVVLVVPLLVVAVALAGPGTSWLDVGVIIGVLGAAVIARLVRTDVRVVLGQPWVEAARALGAPPSWVLRRHVLPHVFGTVAVAATALAATAIGTEATLSYLGLGVHVPDTSLGLLVARHEAALFTRPWLVVPPAVVLATLVISLHLVGDVVAERSSATWRR